MVIYWPTPGLKGRTFKLCVLTRGDFNFCIHSSPLRGLRKKKLTLLSTFQNATSASASPTRSHRRRLPPASCGCSFRLLASSGHELSGVAARNRKRPQIHLWFVGLFQQVAKSSATQDKVTDVLIGFTCNHGCFETLIIDQGKEFKSRQYSWVWDVSCLQAYFGLERRRGLLQWIFWVA